MSFAALVFAASTLLSYAQDGVQEPGGSEVGNGNALVQPHGARRATLWENEIWLKTEVDLVREQVRLLPDSIPKERAKQLLSELAQDLAQDLTNLERSRLPVEIRNTIREETTARAAAQLKIRQVLAVIAQTHRSWDYASQAGVRNKNVMALAFGIWEVMMAIAVGHTMLPDGLSSVSDVAIAGIAGAAVGLAPILPGLKLIKNRKSAEVRKLLTHFLGELREAVATQIQTANSADGQYSAASREIKERMVWLVQKGPLKSTSSTDLSMQDLVLYLEMPKPLFGSCAGLFGRR